MAELASSVSVLLEALEQLCQNMDPTLFHSYRHRFLDIM